VAVLLHLCDAAGGEESFSVKSGTAVSEKG
jgi:hypothetical protein